MISSRREDCLSSIACVASLSPISGCIVPWSPGGCVGSPGLLVAHAPLATSGGGGGDPELLVAHAASLAAGSGGGGPELLVGNGDCGGCCVAIGAVCCCG